MNIIRMKGAALLVLMALILISFTTIAVARLSLNNLQTARESDDAKILAVARDSLIGYSLKNSPAVNLPCPDRNGDGSGLGAADMIAGGCRTYRGWLPFRDLGLPDLRDKSGARLWYAVDQAYTVNGITNLTPSMLTLDGISVVAVILSPKEVFPGQTRINHTVNFTDNFNANVLVTGYLEDVNSVANTTAYTKLIDADQNDQVIGITVPQFWGPVDLLP
jgi:hypothetical protein